MDKSEEAESATRLNQPAQIPEYTLPPPRIWPQYIVALAATLSFFAIGAGRISSLNPSKLGEEVDHKEIKWLFTMHHLGAVAGAPFLGLVAHLCGRKWAAVLIQLLLILAIGMGQIPHDKKCLFLSSYTLGTAWGGALAIIPIYVTEIADDMHRGVMGTLILAMSTVGSYLSIEMYAMKYWVTMLLCTVPCLLAFAGAILMPETPPFLISKGRRNEAAKVLRLLRGEYRQELEMQALESSFSVKASILKPFMISLGLMTLQSFQGVEHSMMTFQSGFYELVGEPLVPLITMALLQAVSLIGAAVAVYFIKWRLLLLISCLGTTVSSFVVCLRYFVFRLPIVDILGGILAIASFFSAAGHLPPIVMVQLLPRKSNAITCSLITTFYLFLNFLQLYIFYFVVDFQYDMIFITVVSALCTIYVFLFVPELKRKPVQTIQDELSHKSFIMLTL